MSARDRQFPFGSWRNANHSDELEARLARLEPRLRHFEYSQRMMDPHITSLQNSLIFRILRRVGQPLLNAKDWATQRLVRSPFRSMCPRLFPPDPSPYTSWMEHEAAGETPTLTALPRFTILLPGLQTATGVARRGDRFGPRSELFFMGTPHLPKQLSRTVGGGLPRRGRSL